MSEIVTNVSDLARIVYSVPDGQEPTKSQRGSITRLCRDGKLNAAKVGKRWVIRIDWPDDQAKKVVSMKAKKKRTSPSIEGQWKIARTKE